MTLTTQDHDRAAAGLTYVYPVLSRRAGGVSLGVNLNVNNACNWGCIYCQVPNLQRGGPPAIDLGRLAAELRQMLDAMVLGDYLAKAVPEGLRRLNDIALSGNGEPTSAEEFPEVVALIGRLIEAYGLTGQVKPLLISNGSLIHRPSTRLGLTALARLGGETWFKLDRATPNGLRRVNQTERRPEQVLRALIQCARLCPTWVQTCVFSIDGVPPEAPEINAYLSMLRAALEAGAPLRGVLLYGLARPSMQPEAARLGRLPEAWLADLAARIDGLGLPTRLFP